MEKGSIVFKVLIVSFIVLIVTISITLSLYFALKGKNVSAFAYENSENENSSGEVILVNGSKGSSWQIKSSTESVKQNEIENEKQEIKQESEKNQQSSNELNNENSNSQQTNNAAASNQQADNKNVSNNVETQTVVKNKKNTGVIYLTFDDGPTTDITPKILDILKQENVKATFFVINYSQDKENLIKREVEEGHAIGIHGYSHEYKDIYKSDEAFMKNVTSLQDKIQKTTGIKTMIMRFPGGSSNTISKKYSKKIMTRLTKKVEEEGFKYYDWNVDSEDAGGAKNKKVVYNNVTKGLKENRKNVVLMHDFAGNNKTLDALKDIIEFGKKNGYTFKGIDVNDDLTVHHGVNN